MTNDTNQPPSGQSAEQVSGAPERIFLVVGELDEPIQFRELADVTWCKDRQFDADIEYVRAQPVQDEQPASVPTVDLGDSGRIINATLTGGVQVKAKRWDQIEKCRFISECAQHAAATVPPQAEPSDEEILKLAREHDAIQHSPEGCEYPGIILDFARALLARYGARPAALAQPSGQAAPQKAEPSDADVRTLLALAKHIEAALTAPISIDPGAANAIRTVVARYGAQPAASAGLPSGVFIQKGAGGNEIINGPVAASVEPVAWAITVPDTSEPVAWCRSESYAKAILHEHPGGEIRRVYLDAPVAAQAQPSGNAGELPDELSDALANLEHDNYERSYGGSKNREADAALIRAALVAQTSAQAPAASPDSPHYEMAFICRVLESEHPAKADLETALGMARSVRVALLKERAQVPAAHGDAPDIAQLYALLPSGPVYLDPPDGGNVTLLEQLRRMSLDAARYRWLRDETTKLDIIDEDGLLLVGDKLDAAIDAARRIEGEAE